MITAPTNWNTLWSQPNSTLELCVQVGSDYYYDSSIESSSCRISHDLYTSYSIGNACSAKFTVTLYDISAIPSGMVKVILWYRLSSEDGATKSGWAHRGTYYLDDVEYDAENNSAKLTCFDAMALMDVYLFQDGVAPSSELWPKNSITIVQRIRDRTGVQFDAASVLLCDGISCPNVDYITCREALQSIAACAGGNWTINNVEKLKFIPLKGLSGTSTVSSMSVSTIKQTSATLEVGGLVLKNGSTSYQRGSGTLVIEAESLYATDAYTNSAFNSIVNLQYAGFTASGCYINPLVEVGDLLSVDDSTAKVFADSLSLFFDNGMWGTVRAPLTDGMEQRIKHESIYGRDIQRLISQTGLMQQAIDSYSTAQYVSDLLARINEVANQTGGYVYITEGDGIVTYDAPVTDPLVGAEATKMTAVRGGLIYIANRSSTSESWVVKSAIQDGHIAAELITAANLIAGYIGSNTGNYWNLDTGYIHTVEGLIGGFTISSSAIYNGLSTLTGTTEGVYIGTSGISVGGREGTAVSGIKRTRITMTNGRIEGYQNETLAGTIAPIATVNITENGTTTTQRGSIIASNALILNAKYLGVATSGTASQTNAEAGMSVTENVFDMDTLNTRTTSDGNLEMDKTKTALKFVNGILTSKSTSTVVGTPNMILVSKNYFDNTLSSEISSVEAQIPTFTRSGNNLYITT